MQSVVNAPPDGYTLAMTFATNTINPSLYKSLPFDFQRDIAPVSGLADLPLVLVVNKDVPAKNVDRVRRLCQSQSGQDHLRVVRRAHHQPSGDRAAQDVHRHRVRSRAVSRRTADHHRPDLRPDSGRDGCAAELAAAHPERRGARARGHVAAAQPGDPRRADDRRDHPGPRDQRRDGHRRAGGDARRDRRAAQPRYQRKPRRPGPEIPLRRCRRGADDLHAGRGPRQDRGATSRNGARSSKAPASSRNDRGRAPQPGALAPIR